MEECYRRIRSLSPEKQRWLGETFGAWFASHGTAVKSLALFYVSKDPVSPEEVKTFLESRLPDHMLPAEYIPLDKLPRTVNGKVDRRALRDLRGSAGTEERRGATPPITDTEKLMAKIWSRVLGVAEVNADDSFFELGGHSLLATQVIMEIEQVFGYQVPLNTVFKHRTLAGISRHLDELAHPQDRAERPPRELPDDGVPLSNAQRRLWYSSQLSERGLEYKILKVLEMEGRLNVVALSQAVQQVVDRHEALRTCFVYVSGKLVQRVCRSEMFNIDHVDLRGLPSAAAEKTKKQITGEILERPFDLEHGPLMRIALVRSSDSRAQLIFDAHHIVIDGWSVGILVKELNSLSRSFAEGSPSELKPLAAQYRHYALKERERIDQEVLNEQLAYWRSKLSGMSPLAFKQARAEAPLTGRDGEIDFDLGDDLQTRVSKLCGHLEITPFMFFISVYYVLLASQTGSRDIAIGTDLANRDSKDQAELIGFFVNQLVLRVSVADDLTFSQLCLQTRECVEEAFAHKDLPYDALVRDLREADRARESLFRAKFVFHHAIPNIAIPGIRTRFVEVKPRMGKFDLLLNVQESNDGFSAKLEYSGAAFDELTVSRMISHFKELCDRAVTDAETSLQTLIGALTATDPEGSRQRLEATKADRRRALREFLQSRDPRLAGDSPARPHPGPMGR